MLRVAGGGRDNEHQRFRARAGAGHQCVVECARLPLGELVNDDEGRAEPVRAARIRGERGINRACATSGQHLQFPVVALDVNAVTQFRVGCDEGFHLAENAAGLIAVARCRVAFAARLGLWPGEMRERERGCQLGLAVFACDGQQSGTNCAPTACVLAVHVADEFFLPRAQPERFARPDARSQFQRFDEANDALGARELGAVAPLSKRALALWSCAGSSQSHVELCLPEVRGALTAARSFRKQTPAPLFIDRPSVRSDCRPAMLAEILGGPPPWRL